VLLETGNENGLPMVLWKHFAGSYEVYCEFICLFVCLVVCFPPFILSYSRVLCLPPVFHLHVNNLEEFNRLSTTYCV
jgi:hypothetical protein